MKFYKRTYLGVVGQGEGEGKEGAIYKSVKLNKTERKFYIYHTTRREWLYSIQSTYRPAALKPITKKQAFIEIL